MTKCVVYGWNIRNFLHLTIKLPVIKRQWLIRHGQCAYYASHRKYREEAFPIHWGRVHWRGVRVCGENAAFWGNSAIALKAAGHRQRGTRVREAIDTMWWWKVPLFHLNTRQFVLTCAHAGPVLWCSHLTIFWKKQVFLPKLSLPSQFLYVTKKLIEIHRKNSPGDFHTLESNKVHVSWRAWK